MKLIDNVRRDKLWISFNERVINKSNWSIYLNQNILLSTLITSNNLIENIYDEINRK